MLNPASHAAMSHEDKCVASAQVFVHTMLNSFIREAAQKAACLLWEETEEVPEQTGEWAEIKSQVQSMSMRLYENAWLAADVENSIAQLGDFEQGESRKPLTDAIAWGVIARFDESRNINHTAQQVCPDLCADNKRRSQLLNSIHKNLSQLVHMGQYLTTFDVPSAKRQRDRAKRKEAEIQSEDSASIVEVAWILAD